MVNRQQTLSISALLVALSCFQPAVRSAASGTSVHLTYHWHLHQPIYWPDKHPAMNRYQYGAESLDLKTAGQNTYPGSTYFHPRNNLGGSDGEFDPVFSKEDRVHAYQERGRDAIQTLLGYADGGASVSYSGSLMENVNSFGKDNRLGYTSTWNAPYTQARGWSTSSGKPRADMVGMTHHHAFSPLLPESVLRKEIRIFKEIWRKSWNGNPDGSDHSKGFWPIECAFSSHMIPILEDEGYEWVIVANSHLARTCPNYLDVAPRGTGGWNIDPPNRADRLGPTVPAAQWWSGSLDGRGGAMPAPFAYQAHRVRHIDPNSGTVRSMIIVPMADVLSYQNGFGTMGTGDIDAHIAPYNDPAQPALVLMAHDGDNAWGGGYDYYMNSVPGLMSQASAKGYSPTTIQQFLTDHPVPSNDVVHVEDGAWVNAANDWGHPQFINWLWPPVRSSSDPSYNASDPRTWYDLENGGWAEDWRNWAVIVAGANYCETAEQVTLTADTVEAVKIQAPYLPNGSYANPNTAELAWHFLLGSLDSGFMYYGTSLDDEVKQSIACNRAVGYAQQALATYPAVTDQTPPTIFKPQRFPWNPGGAGWGPLTGYQPIGLDGTPPYNSDFHVWTLAYDVSGMAGVSLFVRPDLDGTNTLDTADNETYAGGSEVGPWVELPMQGRAIPTGNVPSDPNIDFFQLPDAIADHYWARVEGYTDTLLDYYVAATDTVGNVHRSGIQHVYVGAGDGSSGGPLTVSFDPPGPDGCGDVLIHYRPGGGVLSQASQVYVHVGRNGWSDIVQPDPAMTADGTGGWTYVYSPPGGTFAIDCVFNNGSGVWDNNGGRDWMVSVVNCTNEPPPSGGGPACAVPGSPVITSDPGTQNNNGDNFDFDTSGGFVATTFQGGFGSFGEVYVNYDDNYLYIGGTGLAVGGTDKSAILFLGVDTLATDVTDLRAGSGLPQGLDILANLDLALPADIAVLVADEWGDGTFSNYVLGGGYDFGQGVFSLAPPSFATVTGARLSQFDGTGNTPVGSTDADGNRLTDRWEAAIPWSSLGAAGVEDLTTLTLGGLLCDASVSASNRYVSGNFLGSSATSAGGLNGSGDYGFNDVELTGYAVCIPMGDLDGDGLPDGFETRYFGHATAADPEGHADADGHTNIEELWLGTNPTNPLSGLRVTAIVRTGSLVRVTWTSVGGKSYDVDFSDDLTAEPDQGFLTAATVVESGVADGIETTEAFEDDGTAAPPDAGKAYRIRLAP